MANRELVQAIRTQGVEALSEYRRGRPKDIPDLRGAILKAVDLKQAPLAEADLRDAYLERADLSRADLSLANLTGANLNGANVAGATFFRTILAHCDFNRIEGLEKAHFAGPCEISLSSILNCDDEKIRQILLLATGTKKSLVEQFMKLDIASREHRAVFIAFIRKDGAVARLVQQKLDAAGFRTYPYVIDEAGRGKAFHEIVMDIRREDWVVFLASQAALENDVVDKQIEKVIQTSKLLPIALDTFLGRDWAHYLRNDVMQLKIVNFYDADTPEQKDEALERMLTTLRRGLPEHL